MSRSAEHDFVTSVFIQCAAELSRSEVFGYEEADRGQFDFACTLTRDHSRNLIGQTLTHHAAGIDKDLASLLHDTDSHLPVYLYSDEARHVGRIQEFLSNARHRLADRVEVLRLLSYPSFNVDNETEREVARAAIKNQVVDDLLLNVTFGRLSSVDIDMLLKDVGIPGLLLGLLDRIATAGFMNYPELARTFGHSSNTLERRVRTLFAAGMLEQGVDSTLVRTTTRARVLLRIAHLLMREDKAGPELVYLLNRLGLGSHAEISDTDPTNLLSLPFDATAKRIRLVTELQQARTRYGAGLTGGGFLLDVRPGLPVPPGLMWIGR
ncbi:hypothetical protein ACWIGI_10040 [Nocardia sp. NPDC055321]